MKLLSMEFVFCCCRPSTFLTWSLCLLLCFDDFFKFAAQNPRQRKAKRNRMSPSSKYPLGNDGCEAFCELKPDDKRVSSYPPCSVYFIHLPLVIVGHTHCIFVIKAERWIMMYHRRLNLVSKMSNFTTNYKYILLVSESSLDILLTKFKRLWMYTDACLFDIICRGDETGKLYQ